jgi:hypothetical protein
MGDEGGSGWAEVYTTNEYFNMNSIGCEGTTREERASEDRAKEKVDSSGDFNGSFAKCLP